MTDLHEYLTEVGADHSPLETVLDRLTELQRRRSRRVARLAAGGVGLAVAAVMASILVFQQVGSAPGYVGPAAQTTGTRGGTDPVDSAGTDTADRRSQELQSRQEALEQDARTRAAQAAASAEAAGLVAARSAQASAASQKPTEAAALQQEAVARSTCQYLLWRERTGVFANDTVEVGAAVRLARSCLGNDPASSVDVSWVVIGLDELGAALGYQQQSVPTAVAVLQVVGTDAHDVTRRWLLVVLPDDAHLTLDGRVDGEPTVQQYPVVLQAPAGFDLARLGTVHRP